jgi:hypothetical protein
VLASACIAAAVACSGESDGEHASSPPPVLESGVALAFVYDTSGSMGETVPDGQGKQTPKWVVANRAFEKIVGRLEEFLAQPSPDGPIRVECCLVRFDSDDADVALPMAPFDAARFREWVKDFDRPDGPTPLGDAVRLAGEQVLESSLATKHIVVLTDGENTHPPEPAKALAKLRAEADRQQVVLSTHFVAFDIAADAFRSVLATGATVVSAADEAQLHERMQYILEEKILLEVASPVPPASK